MKSNVTMWFFNAIGGIVLFTLLTGTSAAATYTLVDAEGFEGYSNANLEGQVAATDEGLLSTQWVTQVGATGTAVVESSIYAPGGGTQAVKVDRAAGADDYWWVPYAGAPAAERPYICIEWDMYVEQSSTTQPYGPFFGIDAYDNSAGIKRVGSLGVDSTTGEILYIDSVGGIQPTSSTLPDSGLDTVAFDEWNSFQMILDYTSDTMYGFVNGTQVVETSFVTAGITQFTDADIAAIAASGDAASLAATGTAYFDNYIVFETDDFSKVPEPSTAILALLGSICLACRWSRG